MRLTTAMPLMALTMGILTISFLVALNTVEPETTIETTPEVTLDPKLQNVIPIGHMYRYYDHNRITMGNVIILRKGDDDLECILHPERPASEFPE